MKRWRTWLTLALMVLSLGFLTAADIECEDDEFEFNWPSFRHSSSDCCGGGWYYYEAYDYDPWYWWWW